MTALEFRINGVGEEAGSKRAFTPKGWTRPVITDANKNLKGWQQLVRDAANQAIAGLPPVEQSVLLGAVRLTVAFYLPRPKSLARSVHSHIKKPDLDKCVRAIQDALSKIVYRDDAQIVELLAAKLYAEAAEVPHVDVRVERCDGLAPAFWDVPLPFFGTEGRR